MTVINSGKEGGKRRPSFRGRAYFVIDKQNETARRWPKARGRKLKAKTKNQMEWFLQAQWATKYWAPALQVQVAQALQGTPLLPRDLMTMIMANRFCYITLEDGRRLYPMTAVQDVSESLDVIAQVPGQMLFRGQNWWLPIDVGTPGYVLTYTSDNQPPTWQPASSGGNTYERPRLLPRLADFSLLNAGSGGTAAIAADTTFGLRLDTPAVSTQIRFLSLTAGAPGVAHQVIMRAQPIWPVTGTDRYNNCCILRNTSNAKIIIWGQYNDGFLIQRWNSYSSFNSNLYGPAWTYYLPGVPWMRVSNDLTNLTFAFSPDGDAWQDFATEALATFIVSVDQIGMGNMSNGQAAYDLFQSFEVII